MRPYDLLDANESNWAFVAVGSVGRVQKLLVRTLTALSSMDR